MNVLLSIWALLLVNKMADRKFVYGKDDVLFGYIEEQQQGAPFGDVLDAGTGMHSLRWIATLGENHGMTSFTAITADETMQRNVNEEAEHLGVLEGNHVVIGNWFGELDLPKEQYDTILADYLIGAMDGFSPFRQDEMIPKLARLLKPGGRLYIVGLEPIPDKASGPGNVICKVRQVRDACILLAGHRCYREYPVEWIHKQIDRMAPELELQQTRKFPILYRFATIQRQINVGRSKLPLFATPALAGSMKSVLDDLESQAKSATALGPLKFGFDYVVSAIKVQ